jgi:D-alanyl-D-alanine carboxypeptidase
MASTPPRASSLQAFPFTGLVGVAMLALAIVTGTVARVLPGADSGVEPFPVSGPLPQVSAAAYVVIDAGTGEELASLGADTPRPIGSLVKLMTAYLVLADGPLSDPATVPALSLGDGESAAGLRRGEQLSRRELLEVMLVASANDAADTLARDVAGSEPAFVRRMNATAADLGLGGTAYANAEGLDAIGQRSTARDVAVLARQLMADRTFRTIVPLTATSVGGHRLPTTNDLLGHYPGADGIKTGHTDEAGWCLAASATRDGRRVIAVVLGAPSEQARDVSAAALLDWAFGR